GIGLSINTLPVAAVGMCIGVDFGIYLLSRYREEFAKHRSLEDGIVIGAQTAAKAVIFTGLTMIVPVVLWYWVSSLKFQGEMGLLLAVLLGANMVAALTLVPVIVHLVKPRFITAAGSFPAAAPERKRASRIAGGSIMVLLALAAPAAADVTAAVGPVEVYVTGSLNTHLGFGIHRESETSPAPGESQRGDLPGLHSVYTFLDLESEWSFGDWKARLNPFVIGDLAYAIHDGNQDWRTFEPSRENLEVDDAPQRIFREAYLQYTTELFQVRAGQMTVGWGESDGLRLLDVVNALDVTRQAFLFDDGFRLTRIPQTILRAIVTPPALRVAERTIFGSWSIEGIVSPQIEPARTYLSPDGVYGGTGGGGVWAVPKADWQDRTETLNLAGLVTLDGFLPDEQIRAFDRRPHYEWGDPLLAARVTGEFGQGRVTLNYAQRVGTLLDLPAVKVRRIAVDTSAPPLPRPGFANPVAEAFLDVDLVYPRKHIIGASLNYDLANWVAAPGPLGATSPVVRIEATYTLRHPFNSARRVKPTIELADLTAFPDVTAAVVPDFFQRHDFLQYMVGFDWPLRFAWLNPRAQFFHSFQVFHFKPIGAGEPLAVQPFKRLIVRDDLVFLTYLVFTEYWNRRVVPQILGGFDASALSWFTKSKVSHEIGDHWRVEWGILYFNRGRLAPTASVFGLFDRRTELFLRLGYQF
ncbi:MAG: DUF1302 family protein, partial [Candidatus Binatia bacterium]